jgi:hypothetical protein
VAHLSGIETSDSTTTGIGSTRGIQSNGPARGSVQIHLRLAPGDAARLKELARERDQSLSAAVRFLLRFYRLKFMEHTKPTRG